MSSTVEITVDLDAAAAPPAAESVRQLLMLIEGIVSQDASLDWRLITMTLNSPLRAEVQAFDDEGQVAPEPRALHAVAEGLGVLAALNDNMADEESIRMLAGPDRDRLKRLITPLKGRGGRIEVKLQGRVDYAFTTRSAQQALETIARLQREAVRATHRPPELGSVEGRITDVTTYYSKPALKVRRALSDDMVLCIFTHAATADIGPEHTLEEVWAGAPVLIRGELHFHPDGRLNQVYAYAMQRLEVTQDPLALLREAKGRGERLEPLSDWATDA